MRSKRLLVVLVLGVAGIVVFAAGSAIGSSQRQAGPPVTYNSSGEPVIRSPNGQFSITVGNAGITLKGPSNQFVALSTTGLRARVQSMDLRATNSANVEGELSAEVRGSTLSLIGDKLELNGCAQSVVRSTDSVIVNGSKGTIVPGQQAVCMG